MESLEEVRKLFCVVSASELPKPTFKIISMFVKRSIYGIHLFKIAIQ